MNIKSKTYHASNDTYLAAAMDFSAPAHTKCSQYKMNTIPNTHNVYKGRLSAYQCREKSHSITVGLIEPKVKLCEVTSEIRGCYDMIESIRRQTNEMTAKIDSPLFDWKVAESKINAELELATQQIDELVKSRESIQATSKKREQKRNSIKLRKSTVKQWKHLQMEDRKKKSHAIDERLKRVAENKSVAQRRTQADMCFQGSVRSISDKIVEAAEQLALLESLQTLHILRERNKSSTNVASEAFLTGIEELKSMWNNAIQKYRVEEGKQRDSSTADDPLKKWCATLISQNSLPLSADKVDELTTNRRLWDAFSTFHDNPFASSIPIGWIMPPSKPLPAWSVYRSG